MPAPARPPIKGTSLLFDVFVLAQAVQDMLARGMVESPLTPGEYALYSHVGEAGPCTPTAIARDLHVPATTVSAWVRTMTDRGHVARVRSRADGRSYELALNEAGLAAHAAARETFEVVNTRFLARLVRPEPELREALAAVTAAAAEEGRTPLSGS